jgi:peptidoglycan hydrolase-like protein with peptidoglycan-binding domain
MKLQRELGQLNYYEGPVDGIMGPQTIQAITYLQRDAHLPRTGQMNAATQAALASFLAPWQQPDGRWLIRHAPARLTAGAPAS